MSILSFDTHTLLLINPKKHDPKCNTSLMKNFKVETQTLSQITTAESHWIDAPLVQWQKISFAQAAALTWSISRFSFLGRVQE